MASHEEFQRVLDAYADAWANRAGSGESSVEGLLVALRSHRVDDVFTSPGPVHDLIIQLWDRGVPPERLRSEFQRALWPLIRQGGKAVASSLLDVARTLLSQEWEVEDLSWLELPEGRRRLSDDRKSYDLVLQYFHKRAEEVMLPAEVDDSEDILGQHKQPSANRRDAFEYPVWLQLLKSSPGAALMVGRYRVVATKMAAKAWNDLQDEARRNVYSDGRLILPWSQTEPPTLRCWLPKQ